VWYCGRDCQREDWAEHKLVCNANPAKQTKEQPDAGLQLPPPGWTITITVKGEEPKIYTAQLCIHPLFAQLNLKSLQTAVENYAIITIPLVPADRLDVILECIDHQEGQEGTRKEWLNVEAETFVQMTDGAQTTEGCCFYSTGTMYDNWNHKDLFFGGIRMPKEEYPSAIIEESKVKEGEEVKENKG